MRILFLTTRPPWPGRRGDQVRTAGFVRHLSQRHDVRVLSQTWSQGAVAEPPTGVSLEVVRVGRWAVLTQLALGVLRAAVGGGRPFQNGFYDHAAFRVTLRRQVTEFQPDVVVLVLGRLGHLLDELEQVAPGVPVVVDLVDALSLNFTQRARRQWWLAWLWHWESRRLARWDAALAPRSAALLVVAERDKSALIAGAPPALRHAVMDAVRVVPFGLDVSESDLDDGAPDDDAEHDDDAAPLAVLTGNLGYFPTVDGACHFASRVWPEIVHRVPDARWLLAGARPARTILALDSLPGVQVVPDPPDLEEMVRRARVAIAPMRSGSGTPIKILEAISWGVPVVSTPEAAAGLDNLPPDALAVADSDQAFAERVSEFLLDPQRGRRTARVARHWLRGRHGLAASASRFEQLLLDLVG